MASIAGRDFFQTQFIRSYGLLFEDAISRIFLLKNSFLDFRIVDLKFFQLSILLSDLYLFILSVQSTFYHSLECFVK